MLLLLLLIMLVAVGLRLHTLPAAPPGLTHDEADHGVDAWGVVNGIRPLYFSVGYGREPLFDYATAGLMAFLGPHPLAGRLTAIFFSLLLLAASYAWTRRAFGVPVALLSTAGQAVNFWATMTARHALRSVTMPALLTLALLFFWRALARPNDRRYALSNALVAGLLLGSTFYTYMPARLTWLILPALLVAWALWDRPALRAHWRSVSVSGAVAAATAAPLFIYLARTGVEQRLDQLSGPLDALLAGNPWPLLHNMWQGALVVTQYGDAWTWRYNIPGRPLLPPLMAGLFYVGLALALWAIARRRNLTAHVAALSWLLLGLAPVLITGPDASTTRAIGMQPVLFLYPALALALTANPSPKGPGEEGGRTARGGFETRPYPPPPASSWARGLRGEGKRIVISALAAALFGVTAAQTARAYFVVWATHPEVRVHYETTRLATLTYLNANASGAVAISSPQPDRFHDPALGVLTLTNPTLAPRWFNGQTALLLPNAPQATLAYSGWSAPVSALAALLPGEPTGYLPTAPLDLDTPIWWYRFDTAQHARALLDNTFSAVPPVDFGAAATLLGYRLERSTLGLDVLTLWQVHTATPELKLFTHLRAAADQPPLAQADRLDAPSAFWQPGDYFIQYHSIVLPTELAAGRYALAVGLYTEPQPGLYLRLPVAQDGLPLGDSYELTTIDQP